MSDDGNALCGDAPTTTDSGPHGQGARWDSDGSYPPNYVRTLLPFPTPDTINSPAIGISPDGKRIAGDATVPNPPGVTGLSASSAAYIFEAGSSQLLPFFTTLPQESEGLAVANGNNVVGNIETFYAEDIDRTALTVAVMWRKLPDGTFAPFWIKSNVGNPNPNPTPLPNPRTSVKVNDTTANGNFVVGGAVSTAALQAYADPNHASEAVLFRSAGSSGLGFLPTWLGFPSGIKRNYSRAVKIASDSTNPKGLIIVGTSGGWRLDRYPNPDDKHTRDQRPTVWSVLGNVVTAQQLPMLQQSTTLPHPEFGGAAGVSKGGDFIVGSCGMTHDPTVPDDYVFDAVIWGRTIAPESIKDILEAGGVNLQGFTLDGATGISADGQIACGNGHKFDMDGNAIYFGWVARLPAPPARHPFDWRTVDRKLPHPRVNPIYGR